MPEPPKEDYRKSPITLLISSKTLSEVNAGDARAAWVCAAFTSDNILKDWSAKQASPHPGSSGVRLTGSYPDRPFPVPHASVQYPYGHRFRSLIDRHGLKSPGYRRGSHLH